MINKILHGDNLEVLKKFPKERVDLIYIDPPFNAKFKNESYKDNWKTINDYIEWMELRIKQLHRVLKPTGSFYLHCDYHAGHYLKVICDEIFGKKNFMNEIIWHYGLGGSGGTKSFKRKHDTIFYYVKSRNYTFNAIRGEITKQQIAKYCNKDENGKYMMSYGKKYYLKGGPFLDDVWDIPTISPTSKERSGYPTQKPESLLERIIKVSSNEGDTILDSFCGCGTTLVVSKKLNRQYIGIDSNRDAILISNRRLLLPTK